MEHLTHRSPEEWRRICRQVKYGHIVRGGPERVYDAGVEYVDQQLRPRNAWKTGDRVVELGSGNGRIAMGLANENILYEGFEPIQECVDFCRITFQPYGHFRFHHWDVHNPRYNPTGVIPPESATIPCDDESADLVLCCSLFSHLETTAVAARYVKEIGRILKPSGILWSTWFCSPPNATATSADRTVFPREWISTTLKQSFTIVATSAGDTRRHHDQCAILSVKR